MLVLTHRGEAVVEEHRRMLQAALARNVPSALRELQTHIESGLEHTLAAF